MIKLRKMLKDLLKNKKFRELIGFSLKNEEILDLILFGSIVRGKEEPSDIDILILYAKKEDLENNYKIKKTFEDKGFKIQVTSSTYNQLFSSEFLAREDILLEGYSLKNGKSISSQYGLSSFILFRYSLKNMNDSQRMQFYYSLKGRNKEEGVLSKYNSYKISDNIIISLTEDSEKIKEFLTAKKIDFDEIKILIPKRIANKKLLEVK